jgi:hypothetical protein
MPDGTVYVGFSPDSGEPMYTTPDDEPLRYSFKKALAHAASLSAHGHNDWRVPTRGELRILFSYRASLGGFGPKSGHWSSEASGRFSAWYMIFGRYLSNAAGQEFSAFRKVHLALRCVRTGIPAVAAENVEKTCVEPPKKPGRLKL